MPLSNPSPGTSFTHGVMDTQAGIHVFCSGPAELIDGTAGFRFGQATFAPARAVNPTGNQFAILLHLRPERGNGENLFLAKGRDQYRLYLPDAERLCFSLHTDTQHTLTVAVPDDWYGRWHTVAAAYNGEALVLAVDGEVLGSEAASGELRYSPGSLSLGFDPFSDSTGCGAIAWLRVFGSVPENWRDLSNSLEQALVNVEFSDIVADGGARGVDAISFETVDVVTTDRPGPAILSLPPLEIKEHENVGTFTGEHFSLVIDFPTATILSWRVDEEELLEVGPVHQFWRPPAPAELVSKGGLDSIATAWVRAGYFENLMGVTAMEALQDSPHLVTLDFKGLIIRRNSDVLFNLERRYTLYGNGEVLLEQRLAPATPLPPMGRIGMELRLPKEFNRAIQGPARQIDGHSHVSWAALRNSTGYGLMACSDDAFICDVQPYSEFQRSEAISTGLLTPDSAHTWHLDQHVSHGPSAGAPPGDYGIPVETLDLSIRFRGLRPPDGDLPALAATALPGR